MSLKSVAGITVNDGKFFIARRLPGGPIGGLWEFPGGKVENGESAEAALIREYREELGVAVQTGKKLGAAAFEHKGALRELEAFEVFFPLPEIRLVVHSQWKWADLDEIETLPFAGSDRKLLPLLRSAFKKPTQA